MTHWQWAILLKPAFLFGYAALIAGTLWAVQFLPEGRVKRLATFRFPENRLTGILMLALAATIVIIAVTAPV